MKKNLVLLALACSIVGSAHAADPKVWNGTIRIWSADLCVSGGACDPLPKRLGPEWKVSVEIPDVTTSGHNVLASEKYVDAPWSVILLVTRVNPADGSPSYIITQTSLHEAKLGLIARCARYDAVEAFDFLPPGSCSGANGEKLYGVSLFSPSAGMTLIP